MSETLVGRKNKKAAKRFSQETKKRLGLHDHLEEKDFVRIKAAFDGAETKSLNEIDLRNLFYDVANLVFDFKEFSVLFLRMNTARNGMVTWDEFISYLILGFKEKEIIFEFESLEAPISKAPKVIRSNHRHPINRIKFCPVVKPDRTFDYLDGNYITCSKDGVINYWTLDMEVERTVQSTCPSLVIHSTHVTDVVALPDINVICTSSTECDLRFYDTSARKFELRVIVTSLESAGTCLYYDFSSSIEEESKIIVGDQKGWVRIILFTSKIRGPFKSKPGLPLLKYRYEDLVKGYAPGFRVVEFRNVHSDWVKQVSYYEPLHSVVSCASCPKVSLLMRDVPSSKTNLIFTVPKGITCFCLAENPHLLATGGLDCTVRLWNPFIPQRPNAIFGGHHTAIIALIIQAGKKVFSMSSDKMIKIWDLQSQECIQNYNDVPSELGEFSNIFLCYNPDNRQVILGCAMIVVLEFCPLQSGESTDGNTHSKGVSAVLYNPLFKIVITVGIDSHIIAWDPWLGRRISVVSNAHVKICQGEEIRLEITAACFDPGYQLLLTGATDGSLKVWNFTTGTCIRNLKIEQDCEVSSVAWVGNRIFACGWNKHVTEFTENVMSGKESRSEPGTATGKSWALRHTEDILCLCTRTPQTLVTGTYNGEMIMWQLETGQPYKQYNVNNPTERIKIKYHIDKTKPKITTEAPPKRTSRVTSLGVFGSASTTPKRKSLLPDFMLENKQENKAKAKRLSIVQVPEALVPLRGLAIHCMLFLETRPMDPKVGTLFISLENGQIQIWSHHTMGGFLGSFYAIHAAGDYIVSMATDEKNEYLFTGTCTGYIKTWLLKNYLIGTKKIQITLPKYRLIFPFLWNDLWEGRAKRANRGQKLPILLNCFKGHYLPVSDIDFINDNQTFISCSADNTARLWTLGGRYLHTLGTFKTWIHISRNIPPSPDRPYTMPADLKRTISSTTFKVYSGGAVERKKFVKKLEDKDTKIKEIDIVKAGIYGNRISEPIMGNHYRLPERKITRHNFVLDNSSSYIPVYQHLIMPLEEEFERPKTPEAIKDVYRFKF